MDGTHFQEWQKCGTYVSKMKKHAIVIRYTICYNFSDFYNNESYFVEEKDSMKKYTIFKHPGALSQPNNGWTKELNYISWSGREPVYGIRTWDGNHVS